MPWPKRYWKIGETRAAGRGLGRGEGVELGEAAGDGLLEDDVAAGGEGGDGLRDVQVRRGADVDEVEVAGEEVVEGGDGGRDAVLAGDGGGAGGVDVAEDRDLVEVGEGGDSPRCARRRCPSRRRRP